MVLTITKTATNWLLVVYRTLLKFGKLFYMVLNLVSLYN